MDQLRIKDLEVYAYHGVFPAEKELGQRFVLDLWVDYEMTRAARTGDLEASDPLWDLGGTVDRVDAGRKDRSD